MTSSTGKYNIQYTYIIYIQYTYCPISQEVKAVS